MRPSRLELEGFTAFREPTAVDFDGADLFVLCGQTGAGKSSLIDAMTFALYGSVSRYEDRNLVHPVVSQGLLEAKVRFDFSVDDTPYTAVRVVRKTKTGAQTKEARLESNGRVLAGSVGELDEKVRELFGLSFDQFTTCVVLPQGQFARFLHGTSGDRQQLLRELLGLKRYGRMRQLAGQRETAARQRVAKHSGGLEQLAGATRAARRELEERVKVLRKLVKVAEKERKAIAEFEATEVEQRRQADEHRRSIKVLGAVKPPRGLDKLGRDWKRAATDLETNAKARTDAEASLEAAERAAAKAPNPRPIEKQIEAHHERERLRRRLQDAQKHEVAAEKLRAAAEQKLEAAKKVQEKAHRQREDIVCANAAHHLASGLSKGDACPVCRRPVDKKPRHAAPPGLDTAQQAVDKAGKAVTAAESEARKAGDQHAAAAATAKEIRARLAELDRTLSGAPDVKTLEASLSSIAEATNAIEVAKRALVSAKEKERKERGVVEGLTDRVRAAQEEFGKARDRVAALEPPAAGDPDDPAASWQALVDWAAGRAADLEEQARAAANAADHAAAEKEAKLAALREACIEAGVETAEGQDPRDAALRAASSAEQQLERIRADIEEAKRIRQELKEAEADRAVAHSLARHLSADGFERWLLGEAFDRLVEAAGERMRELSNQSYSFHISDKLEFGIVDHGNADEVRPARTLSGGETFLASLALALTLADQIADLAAEGAARLESMFLDEGFGTLDAETLDTVASTIEELGSRGRTIGLVTHVRELADRIPVQYRVSKGPATSSVEKVIL